MAAINSNYDVIIIGAGPAGLTAAYELLTKTNLRPLILEATPYIGGLSRSYTHNGNIMDAGCHRFFSKSDAVMNLWTQILPLQGSPSRDDVLLKRDSTLTPGGPDPETEDKCLLVRPRITRIMYLRKFFDYPISMKPQTFLNMGLFRTIYAGCGYLLSVVFKRREVSLKDFMINRFGVPLYKMFFEDYTTKVWGRNPKDISAAWGKQRIKGISLTKALWSALTKVFGIKTNAKKQETSLIEQFVYPKLGTGQMWESLLEKCSQLAKEKFGADYEICLQNANVTAVNVKDGKIESVTVNGDSNPQTFSADYLLSSMPVKDLVNDFSGMDVPDDIADIAKHLPYRNFISVGVLAKNLNLPNTTNVNTIQNIPPDNWLYIQERDVKIGRLTIFNNWSPYMIKDFEHTVWIEAEYFCDESDWMWNASDSEFIPFVIDELAKINVLSKENVLDSVCLKSHKAYPAYFDSYEHFDKLRDFLDTIPNLYCIGRNGQHRYNNMDHSMLCAMEAVNLIVQGKTDKSTLWNVNAEQEYHETKK